MILDHLHSEPVGGGPGFVVVRIHGRGYAEAPGRAAPPTFLIDDDGVWRRLATVPGTPPLAIGPDGPAFAVEIEVPLHLVVSESWWLEPGVPMDAGSTIATLAARIDALTVEVRALREQLAPLGPTAPSAAHRLRTATSEEPRPGRHG